MSIFNFNPYGTFNFTEEEFTKASKYTKLKCICKHCNNEYGIKKSIIERVMDPNDQSNHNRICSLRYCSKQCQKLDNPDNEIVDVVCAHCGCIAQRPKKRVKETKTGLIFCSPKCSRQYYSEHDIARASTTKINHTNPNGNFLFSEDDYNKVIGPKSRVLDVLPVRCLECGETFFVSAVEVQDFYLCKNNQNRLKFCSRACFGKYISSHSNERLLKSIETCNKKFGVDCYAKTDECKSRIKQTCIDKYGVSNTLKCKSMRAKGEQTRRSKYYDSFIVLLSHKHVRLITPKDDYINNIESPLTYECIECNHVWESDVTNPQNVYCPDCCRRPWSNKELSLTDKIREFYNGEIQQHVRGLIDGRKELDIFIPDKNIAIEFNGNFYHSEAFANPETRHIEKTKECNKRGIRLIHVFEYEWDHHPDKILNLIKSALGIFDRVIYARQCDVREVDHKTSVEFLDNYHLQSSVNSSIRLGLFYNDELVSLITVGKSRFTKNEYELYRYCNKSGVRIVGGFSKLLTHLKSTYCIDDRLVSYIDLSHFTGDGYKAVGFEEVSYTSPNYRYYKGTKILTRMQCQKHKLPELLGESFNPDLNEQQNMINEGYLRIYDCGNLKVVYKR